MRKKLFLLDIIHIPGMKKSEYYVIFSELRFLAKDSMSQQPFIFVDELTSTALFRCKKISTEFPIYLCVLLDNVFVFVPVPHNYPFVWCPVSMFAVHTLRFLMRLFSCHPRLLLSLRLLPLYCCGIAVLISMPELITLFSRHSVPPDFPVICHPRRASTQYNFFFKAQQSIWPQTHFFFNRF